MCFLHLDAVKTLNKAFKSDDIQKIKRVEDTQTVVSNACGHRVRSIQVDEQEGDRSARTLVRDIQLRAQLHAQYGNIT